MNRDWKTQKQRSTPQLVSLLVWIAMHLGRSTARALLWPISLYFFFFNAPARRASASYLRRVGAPSKGALGVLRHFHTFAACALDRVFLLSGRYRGIRVTVHDPDEILPKVDPVGGALVPTAHLGSFDVLRVIGTDRKGMRFRIVMDRTHGSMVTSILDGLNPGLARELIDGGSGGPTLALALQEALQSGHMVGLMADRVTPRDRSLPVSFLGAPARLPDSLWRLAAVLGTPVVLSFGLYLGGDHYELHFERFLEGGMKIPRPERAAFVQACAERYAKRLEHYVRLAPYNWFNFYDFWEDEATGDQ